MPTFLQLLGEEVIGAEWARRIKYFNYDDPQLVAVHYAMKGDPVFASAEYDPAIQRTWVGYFGGESLDDIRSGQAELMSGVVPDEVMGGWFNFTRADPAQAPPGLPHHLGLAQRAAAPAALAGQAPQRLGQLARGAGRGPRRRHDRSLRGVRAGLQGPHHREGTSTTPWTSSTATPRRSAAT